MNVATNKNDLIRISHCVKAYCETQIYPTDTVRCSSCTVHDNDGFTTSVTQTMPVAESAPTHRLSWYTGVSQKCSDRGGELLFDFSVEHAKVSVRALSAVRLTWTIATENNSLLLLLLLPLNTNSGVSRGKYFSLRFYCSTRRWKFTSFQHCF